MLRWTIVLFVLALVAAVLGFGGIADGIADIAQILFVVFLVGVVITFFAGRRTVAA